jgi:uncharacterized membrane protein (DUF4010 family)
MEMAGRGGFVGWRELIRDFCGFTAVICIFYPVIPLHGMGRCSGMTGRLFVLAVESAFRGKNIISRERCYEHEFLTKFS